MNQSAKTPDLSCALNDQDYSDRRKFARRMLMPHLRTQAYTQAGVDLVFIYSEVLEANLELFVSLEAQCCGFLNFDISRQEDEVKLAIAGPADAKELIRKFAEGLSAQPVSS